jgi:hypothetical protein
MSEPEDKKRLKLASEELPAPSLNPEGNPRQRTLRRLGCLTGVAATGAVVGGYLLSRPGEDGLGGLGYGVVDPMPPPARCIGLAATLRAAATWSGPDTILVTFEAPTALGARYLAIHPFAAEGETRWKIDPDHAEVMLKVTETTERVKFGLYVACNPDGQGAGGDAEVVWAEVIIDKQGAPPAASGSKPESGRAARAVSGRTPAAARPSLSVVLSDVRNVP